MKQNINISQELLNIDKDNFCKYNLSSSYEAAKHNMSYEDKVKLVNAIYNGKPAAELYNLISGDKT